MTSKELKTAIELVKARSLICNRTLPSLETNDNSKIWDCKKAISSEHSINLIRLTCNNEK